MAPGRITRPGRPVVDTILSAVRPRVPPRGPQKYRGSGNPAIGTLVVHKPLGPCRAAMTWQDDAWRASYLPPARGAPDKAPRLGSASRGAFFVNLLRVEPNGPVAALFPPLLCLLSRPSPP